MSELVLWIVVGIVAGFLAKAVVPGEGPGGIIGDVIVGAVGAFLAGWAFNTFLWSSFAGRIGSALVAFMGAVFLLFALRTATGHRMAAKY